MSTKKNRLAAALVAVLAAFAIGAPVAGATSAGTGGTAAVGSQASTPDIGDLDW
jgi:hypothetical protein